MEVAVFGASGFIGSHTCERLRADGVAVRELARRSDPPLDALKATETEMAGAIFGCDAVVNVIGIKCPDGAQTFHAMHVTVLEKILVAMSKAGVRRLVNISVVVSKPDPGSAYHDTKWQADELLRASGVDWTLLKPGVVYGRGDNMLGHLTLMIGLTRFFPIVDCGRSQMQPVCVLDVAAAISACVQKPETIGKTFDVVGPAPMELRKIVRTVAEAMGKPVVILPTPYHLMKPAVHVMGWVMREPLSTPAQLQMLREGMTGDVEPMRRELGVEPRPFTAENIRGILPGANDVA